ncbi:MAG: GFA family protein [Pseudomonadota bacterium]
MQVPSVHEGGCLCGSVRFAVASFQSGVYKCHCSRCRKAFGGASSAAILVAQDQFQWLRGEETINEYRTDSGFLRRFCPKCGSPLPQFLSDYDLVWMPAGLLDGDPELRLTHHIYTDSKACWEVLDADTPRRPEGF